jgi:hypothetical protein
MSELLLNDEKFNDEKLSTADIVHPERSRDVQQAIVDDRNRQTDPQVFATQKAPENSVAPLVPDDELHNFRARWDQVQTSFVDEPRQAVEQADSLVANVVKRIAEQFSNERAKLEEQWAKGDNVSTEDLRQGLKRYRAFFDRLLSF